MVTVHLFIGCDGTLALKYDLLCSFTKFATRSVLFFPVRRNCLEKTNLQTKGDIQNTKEVMQGNPHASEFANYSLEDTTIILAEKFAPCNVVVVKLLYRRLSCSRF